MLLLYNILRVSTTYLYTQQITKQIPSLQLVPKSHARPDQIRMSYLSYDNNYHFIYCQDIFKLIDCHNCPKKICSLHPPSLLHFSVFFSFFLNTSCIKTLTIIHYRPSTPSSMHSLSFLLKTAGPRQIVASENNKHYKNIDEQSVVSLRNGEALY